MKKVLAFAAVAVMACAAQAQLVNGDIETVTSNLYGSIDGWGPAGGWADHAGHSKPGNESLGVNFGFMSSGGAEAVGQVSSLVFQPNTTYVFSGWSMGGGDNVGTTGYQIGYGTDAGAGFILLDSTNYDVDGTWGAQAGVAYTTGATGAEIGQPIIVRLHAELESVSDIWFDNLTLTPEPASLIMLALGGLVLRRR